MRRTFPDQRPIGAKDQFTWAYFAGLAWLVVGLLTMALIFTFWYAGAGLMAATMGSCLPFWFAYRLLLRPNRFWTAVAAAYGAALAAGVLTFAASTGGSEVIASAIAIPAAFSAVAAWELHRES